MFWSWVFPLNTLPPPPVSGPRLDMDPDIVAALDEDFDFDDPENILEDDFVIKANDVASADGNTGWVLRSQAAQ